MLACLGRYEPLPRSVDFIVHIRGSGDGDRGMDSLRRSEQGWMERTGRS